MRKVFFSGGRVSKRDMAGMVRRGINYWIIDLPIGWGVTVGIRAFHSKKDYKIEEKENLGHDHTRD